MTAKYEIPFKVTDIPDLSYDQFMTLVEKHGLGTTFYFDDHPTYGSRSIEGTAQRLAAFYAELDGPGQSFPISEFVEYIQDFKMEA